jgi:hypothetical protein
MADVKSVSEVDLAGIAAAPAAYANRFFVSLYGPIAKVTFGEQQPDNSAVMRTSVVLTIGDLIELRDLLTIMLKDVERPSVDASSQVNGA